MDRTNAKRAAERLPTRPTDEEDGTRDRILKTAERLFAERGFNGVSVRELASAANVNIASIGYHFRNKEGLLAEVYRRHCEPMIEERLRGLTAASRLEGSARVAAIIEAFVRPALQQVEVEEGETFIRLRAVLSGQTDPASPPVMRLSDNIGYNAQLRTTCITTLLQAGTAFNALPQLATATVNCRVMPGEPIDGIKATLEKVLADDQIAVTQIDQPTLSAPSALSEEIVGPITKLSAEFFPGAVVLPNRSENPSRIRAVASASPPMPR